MVITISRIHKGNYRITMGWSDYKKHRAQGKVCCETCNPLKLNTPKRRSIRGSGKCATQSVGPSRHHMGCKLLSMVKKAASVPC